MGYIELESVGTSATSVNLSLLVKDALQQEINPLLEELSLLNQEIDQLNEKLDGLGKKVDTVDKFIAALNQPITEC